MDRAHTFIWEAIEPVIQSKTKFVKCNVLTLPNGNFVVHPTIDGIPSAKEIAIHIDSAALMAFGRASDAECRSMASSGAQAVASRLGFYDPREDIAHAHVVNLDEEAIGL
jgi:hypothetical protein